MKSELSPSYEVIKTTEFIEQTFEISKRHPRVIDLIKSVEWNLSRRPHAFTQMGGNFYLLNTGQLANPEFPEVVIIYRVFDSEKLYVSLLAIED